VTPRDGRVEDRDVALVTATDERVALRKIEFLQQESQAVSRWIFLARIAHSGLRLLLPRDHNATIIRAAICRFSRGHAHR
jgi:hypothetical protein